MGREPIRVRSQRNHQRDERHCRSVPDSRQRRWKQRTALTLAAVRPTLPGKRPCRREPRSSIVNVRAPAPRTTLRSHGGRRVGGHRRHRLLRRAHARGAGRRRAARSRPLLGLAGWRWTRHGTRHRRDALRRHVGAEAPCRPGVRVGAHDPLRRRRDRRIHARTAPRGWFHTARAKTGAWCIAVRRGDRRDALHRHLGHSRAGDDGPRSAASHCR